jgi:RNA-binding protein NOB1
MEEKRIGLLVVDSGAFIKRAPLEKWSSKVVTVRDVVSEIRDKASRERLQVLPFDLSFREPSADALQHGELHSLRPVSAVIGPSLVTRFAKKTGDYGALSSVDLKLISLTYQLHCELDPLSVPQLRQEPLKQVIHPIY